MSGIRGRDTTPEISVRRALSAAGLRYRLHPKALPGRPDIVLPKARTAVFVHGCFWHRHQGCKFAYTPKSNVRFWTEKFASNILRDKAAKAALRKDGWRVFIIWECQVNERRLNALVRNLGARRRT
jgi:DNA mismatch endonuclease, patch repair protein